MGNVAFQNTAVAVFPGFSTEMTKQLARFVKAKWKLHLLKYAILYSARLHFADDDCTFFINFLEVVCNLLK